MSERVTATAQEIVLARKIGPARTAAARARGYVHWGGEQGADYDSAGVLAELLCARFLGLPFGASVGEIDNVDLEKVEVRGRILGSGFLPDLGMRPVDKHLGRPYVLVHVAPTLQWVDLVGWLVGWEALDRVVREHIEFRPREKCWFVPPPYHSVKSLQDWLFFGAPPHERSSTWMVPDQVRDRADAQSGRSAPAHPPADRRPGGVRGADPADAGG